MTTYFTPPTRKVRLSVERPHPLLSRISFDSGLTVLKSGSSYVTVETPSAEQLQAADIAYIGGHPYPVSVDEAAALTAAGYGSYLSTS